MARWGNFLALPLLLLLKLSLFASAALPDQQLNCTNHIIPVTIHAENQDLSVVTAPVFNVTVDGTFNISARYCQPGVHVAQHTDILQFLVHGLTYTHKYWTANGWTTNSWVGWAATNGYPTLAIDLLGSGNSSHPDPSLVVQMAAQVEIVHQVLNVIRSESSPLPSRYSKIIYAGHSFGSTLGNALVTKYPEDVSALILTGYSSSIVKNISAALLPAHVSNPSRFGNLLPGYLQFANREGFRETFYSAYGYDNNTFDRDYSSEDTMTIGEVSTVFQGLNVASGFTGPVYVLTGKYDKLFCNANGTANCGTDTRGYLPDTRQLFPAAKQFATNVLDDAGHSWVFHYTGITGIVDSMAWLSIVGF